MPDGYLRLHRPRLFIAENVEAVKSEKHWPEIQALIAELQQLGYHTSWKIMNTADFLVPQQRNRFYLVSVRADSLRQRAQGMTIDTVWPQACPLCIQLDQICKRLPRTDGANAIEAMTWQPHPPSSDKLGHANVRDAYAKVLNKNPGFNPFLTPIVADCGSSPGFASSCVGRAPTLTRRRCQSGGYWLSTKGGKLDVNELSKLQGFALTSLCLVHPESGKPLISDFRLRGAIGNMMSVNVLLMLLPRALYLAKLITKDELDRCAAGAGTILVSSLTRCMG